jgi:hypothetical protein
MTQTRSTPPFELFLDEKSKLVLRRPGEEDVTDVRIRRSFPWSDPGHFVSIRSSDGKELLLIEDVSALSEAQHRMIESSLETTVLIPRITRIDSIDVRFGFQQWRVQTDRGAIEFRVQERDDIRFLPDGRYTLRDADGNVYELPTLDELDDASRRALEPLI